MHNVWTARTWNEHYRQSERRGAPTYAFNSLHFSRPLTDRITAPTLIDHLNKLLIAETLPIKITLDINLCKISLIYRGVYIFPRSVLIFAEYLCTDHHAIFWHSARFCKRHSCFASGRRTSCEQRKHRRPDAEWSEKASWRLVRWNGVALAPALIQFSILVSLSLSLSLLYISVSFLLYILL